MPEGKNKNQNPQINSRGRPRGARNSEVRSDRQEACRLVAAALIKEPTATVRRLAELAWPTTETGETGEETEKARKRAHERARRALADLFKNPALASAGLEAAVREALAVREAAVERVRQERERKRAEREKRREERRRRWEERLRQMPARALAKYMLRTLRGAEIDKEFYQLLEAKRREDDRYWLFPAHPGQVPEPARIYHPAPGMAGQVVTSTTATRVANAELAVQRAATNLSFVPLEVARDVIIAAKRVMMYREQVTKANAVMLSVKKGLEEGKIAPEKGEAILRKLSLYAREAAVAEMKTREESQLLLYRALDQTAPLDPDERSDQYKIKIAGIDTKRYEVAMVKEAGLWPLPGVVNLGLSEEQDTQVQQVRVQSWWHGGSGNYRRGKGGGKRSVEAAQAIMALRG